jgi:hypothetical protein
MKQHEERQLIEGIKKLVVDSKTFGFLNDKEYLYSAADLKETYINE